MTTIRITGPTQLAHALTEVAMIPQDGSTEVLIRSSKGRSNAQNRLAWMWAEEWAKHLYETDVEMQYLRMKWRYGKHIFIQEQPELVDMVSAIDAIYETPQYNVLALSVAGNMRSSKLKVKPFSKWLECVETELRQKGVDLTITGGLYLQAMGKGG